MELTRERQKAIQAKNTALMSVVGLRCMMEIATFDLGYGNPANWRVLYHNTLDAYLQMPETPTPDVVCAAADVMSYASGLMIQRLSGTPEVKPLVVNLTVDGAWDHRLLAQRLLEDLKALAVAEEFTVTIQALNVYGAPNDSEEARNNEEASTEANARADTAIVAATARRRR